MNGKPKTELNRCGFVQKRNNMNGALVLLIFTREITRETDLDLEVSRNTGRHATTLAMQCHFSYSILCFSTRILARLHVFHSF